MAALGEAHALATVDGGASNDVASSLGSPGSFLIVEGPRSQCVQLDSVLAPDGSALVTPRDSGPICRSCAQRNAPAAGLAFFSLPSDASELAAGMLTARIALRDCDTLTDIAGAFQRSQLRSLPMREHPAAAPAVLRASAIALTGTWLESVVLRGDASEWAALEGDVSARLDAGITVRFARRCRSVGGDLVFRERDYAVVDATLDRAFASCPDAKSTADDPLVPIVATTCLRVTDALTGDPLSPQGQTTHIPGISGISTLSDAVLVAPSSCGTYSAGDAAVERAVFIATVAHEIGHYLGLYHTVNPDDLLADTNADNLMSPNPLGALSRSLSPSQRIIVRRHPAVRWPVACP